MYKLARVFGVLAGISVYVGLGYDVVTNLTHSKSIAVDIFILAFIITFEQIVKHLKSIFQVLDIMGLVLINIEQERMNIAPSTVDDIFKSIVEDL